MIIVYNNIGESVDGSICEQSWLRFSSIRSVGVLGDLISFFSILVFVRRMKKGSRDLIFIFKRYDGN